LSYLPFRYELVPDIEDIERPWRHILFGKYRIIYRVDAKRVTILRIVHAAQLLGQSFFTRLLRGGEE
jgi:plasmid stabilization system protein ParE